ncbi:MAG: RNA polymerase sigma factor [Ilumatobacteraceae bacterium]
MSVGVDEARFRELFNDTEPAIVAYVRRRCADPTEVADVVAETFLVAWRRLRAVPRGPEALFWLYGTARHVLLNQQRSSFRKRRLLKRFAAHIDRSTVVADPSPTDELVRAALERIPATDAELLRLVYWEGLAPVEIATMLNTPAPTVRSQLTRARRRLRSQIAPAAARTPSRMLVQPLAQRYGGGPRA